MLKLTGQLEMLGLDETKRRVAAEGATPAERKRLLRRVEVTHELMSADRPRTMRSGAAALDGSHCWFSPAPWTPLRASRATSASLTDRRRA